MSADMHRGQRASLGRQTNYALKAGYKKAADFFTTQHKFFLLSGRHPYKTIHVATHHKPFILKTAVNRLPQPQLVA